MKDTPQRNSGVNNTPLVKKSFQEHINEKCQKRESAKQSPSDMVTLKYLQDNGLTKVISKSFSSQKMPHIKRNMSEPLSKKSISDPELRTQNLTVKTELGKTDKNLVRSASARVKRCPKIHSEWAVDSKPKLTEFDVSHLKTKGLPGPNRRSQSSSEQVRMPKIASEKAVPMLRPLSYRKHTLAHVNSNLKSYNIRQKDGPIDKLTESLDVHHIAKPSSGRLSPRFQQPIRKPMKAIHVDKNREKMFIMSSGCGVKYWYNYTGFEWRDTPRESEKSETVKKDREILSQIDRILSKQEPIRYYGTSSKVYHRDDQRVQSPRPPTSPRRTFQKNTNPRQDQKEFKDTANIIGKSVQVSLSSDQTENVQGRTRTLNPGMVGLPSFTKSPTSEIDAQPKVYAINNNTNNQGKENTGERHRSVKNETIYSSNTPIKVNRRENTPTDINEAPKSFLDKNSYYVLPNLKPGNSESESDFDGMSDSEMDIHLSSFTPKVPKVIIKNKNSITPEAPKSPKPRRRRPINTSQTLILKQKNMEVPVALPADKMLEHKNSFPIQEDAFPNNQNHTWDKNSRQRKLMKKRKSSKKLMVKQSKNDENNIDGQPNVNQTIIMKRRPKTSKTTRQRPIVSNVADKPYLVQDVQSYMSLNDQSEPQEGLISRDYESKHHVIQESSDNITDTQHNVNQTGIMKKRPKTSKTRSIKSNETVISFQVKEVESYLGKTGQLIQEDYTNDKGHDRDLIDSTAKIYNETKVNDDEETDYEKEMNNEAEKNNETESDEESSTSSKEETTFASANIYDDIRKQMNHGTEERRKSLKIYDETVSASTRRQRSHSLGSTTLSERISSLRDTVYSKSMFDMSDLSKQKLYIIEERPVDYYGDGDHVVKQNDRRDSSLPDIIIEPDRTLPEFIVDDDIDVQHMYHKYAAHPALMKTLNIENDDQTIHGVDIPEAVAYDLDTPHKTCIIETPDQDLPHIMVDSEIEMPLPKYLIYPSLQHRMNIPIGKQNNDEGVHKGNDLSLLPPIINIEACEDMATHISNNDRLKSGYLCLPFIDHSEPNVNALFHYWKNKSS
ncbi:unnamed protein product [Owenia fusiformis]|uniref:Uncharacterized protein n=1 Tax=Owenia fusiformis TaxID=6347 RepID=A0A8J1TTX6_OWEFU|nr:unnamed protein product [Owenia fusiformis]